MSRLHGHYVAAVALAIGIVVVALYPQFRSDYDTSTVSQVGIYFIAIIGLNVVTGYNGQISLGQGAFMGIGAYTTAIMAGHDISVWWSIPVAAAAAGAVGFVFGFPALRLHGPYLALGTFALAIAFFQLLQSARPNLRWLTNGGQTRVFGEPSTPYYQTWSIALGLLLLAWLVLSGSSAGRSGPSATRSSRRSRPASTPRSSRRLPSASRPPTRELPVRCSRSSSAPSTI